MMKEVAGNVCAVCVHFVQYYTVKCFHNFETTEYGLCNIKNQTVKAEEACDNFCRRKGQRVTAEEIKNAVRVLKDLEKLL